jgi:hypothetical protein
MDSRAEEDKKSRKGKRGVTLISNINFIQRKCSLRRPCIHG